MNTLLFSLRDRINRQIAYRRTLHELRALPLNIKLDLDISGIEDKVAQRAIWG